MANTESSQIVKSLFVGIAWPKTKTILNVESLSGADKTFIGKACLDEIGTTTQIASKTGISARTLRRWRHCVKNGILIPDKPGRFSILSAASIEHLSKMIENGDSAISLTSFNEEIVNLAQRDYLKRKNELPNAKLPSKRTLRRLDKVLGLTNKNGEKVLVLDPTVITIADSHDTTSNIDKPNISDVIKQR